MLVAILLGSPSTSPGTELNVAVSSRTCALDEILTLQIKVVNPQQASTPDPEATNDFDIRLSPGVANPAQSSQVNVINGRMSRRITYTYTFDLRPLRAGRLKVPSFALIDNGRTYKSESFPVLCTKPSGPQAVFCKVVTKRDVAFVGEPIEIALEIWVRKFRQRGFGTLDVDSTFSGLNKSSRFGIFRGAAGRRPAYRDAVRTDEDGTRNPFIVFTWDTTVYGKATGPFDFGDIVIAWTYPVQVRRGFFGRIEHVRSPRKLRVVPQFPSLEIKRVPFQGRPPEFSGAVGKFSISTTATPTRVPVGDPITLTLVIRGDVPLDRLRAPRLEHVEALTKDFEISGESLAGELKRGRKVFSQTIRALREEVGQIPPIPFSAFDPETKQYVTTWSRAIPLRVRAAERLALAPGADETAVAPAVLAPLVETTDGLQANYAHIDNMLTNQSAGFGAGSMALLTGMPAIYLVTWFVTRRSERFREDIALRRRRQALSRAKRALRQTENEAAPFEAAGPLLTYIADRCNVPEAGLIRADAIRLLAERGVAPETQASLDALLESLEQARYGGGAGMTANEVFSKARALIHQLERHDLR